MFNRHKQTLTLKARRFTAAPPLMLFTFEFSSPPFAGLPRVEVILKSIV